MRHSRTSPAGLAAVALLLAACNPSGSSPSPTAPVTTPTNAGAPSAVLAAPPAPINFAATRKSASVPCPSSADSCSEVDFAWKASADPGAGFRIYVAATGEGPDATCLTEQASATVRLGVKPAARTAQAFDPMATGRGQICYWITAVNGSGESAQVPAASNTVNAPSPGVAAPPAPTNFTATRSSGSVPCPSPEPDGGNCAQTDLAWQANADPGTGFRIYVAATGEGPDATCPAEQASATVRLETKPAARTAQAFDQISTGGGQICYWITAVNISGESAQVPAAGN